MASCHLWDTTHVWTSPYSVDYVSVRISHRVHNKRTIQHHFLEHKYPRAVCSLLAVVQPRPTIDRAQTLPTVRGYALCSMSIAVWNAKEKNLPFRSTQLVIATAGEWSPSAHRQIRHASATGLPKTGLDLGMFRRMNKYARGYPPSMLPGDPATALVVFKGCAARVASQGLRGKGCAARVAPQGSPQGCMFAR